MECYHWAINMFNKGERLIKNYKLTKIYKNCNLSLRGVSKIIPPAFIFFTLVLFFVIWLGSLHSNPHSIEECTPIGVSTFRKTRNSVFGITFNAVVVLISTVCLSSWEPPEVAGDYVETVQSLTKLYDIVFCWKLLNRVRWKRWCITVVEKPVRARWSRFRLITSRNLFLNFK